MSAVGDAFTWMVIGGLFAIAGQNAYEWVRGTYFAPPPPPPPAAAPAPSPVLTALVVAIGAGLATLLRLDGDAAAAGLQRPVKLAVDGWTGEPTPGCTCVRCAALRAAAAVKQVN